MTDEVTGRRACRPPIQTERAPSDRGKEPHPFGRSTDRTAEIQAALDLSALSRRIVLGPGRHLAGGLRLQSGTELHQAAGAELCFRTEYDAFAQTTVGVVAEDSDQAMIVAAGATDIALTGPGRILAGGAAHHHRADADMGTHLTHAQRPRVPVFEECRIVVSNRGLGIFSRDGGTFENLRFSRIELECRETPDGFWGSGEALTVNMLDRRPDLRPAGRIRNVLVEDTSGTMQGAINLHSERDGGVSDITLRRISIAQQASRLGTAQCDDLRLSPRASRRRRPTKGARTPGAGATTVRSSA